jgi:hypothetical protein
MAFPFKTTGSLCPCFHPARFVYLTVKLPSAIALYARLPSVLREPLKASDTLLEATTPVKLPIMHCPLPYKGGVRSQRQQGWYFKIGSIMPDDTTSKPPTYPTHVGASPHAKL